MDDERQADTAPEPTLPDVTVWIPATATGMPDCPAM